MPSLPTRSAIESGPVTSNSAIELFLRLARSRSTGILEYRDGDRRKSVSIRDGEIQTAASSDRDDRFSCVLLTEEAVRIHQLSAALEVSLPENRRLGEVVVEQGHLTEGEVRHYLKLQFSRILDQIFAWERGEFSFEPRPVRRAEVGLHVRCDRWIVETHRRQTFWARVAEFLGGINTTFVSASGRDAELQQLGLLPEEIRLIELAHAPATVEELCARSEMGELATARMLWVMTQLGLLIRN